MEDHSLLVKIAISTLGGVLAFIAAIFTTVLDVNFFWRTVWLSVCLVFFFITLAGVFALCGEINSGHQEPEGSKSSPE